MYSLKRAFTRACLGVAFCTALPGYAQSTPKRCESAEYHQFDFWIGTWNVSDMQGALQGVTTVSRRNDCVLEERWTSSTDDQTGASFNMYDFRTRKWFQSWFDSYGNMLTISGGLKSGAMWMEGERLTPDGKLALERTRWIPLPDGTIHHIWDYTLDNRSTWTTRFEAKWSRQHSNPSPVVVSHNGPQTSAPTSLPKRDGQHDFDFYQGRWKVHNRRLLHPLSGSSDWVEFDGTSVDSAIWNGRANLDEFEADSPSGHIQGMTLRLYEPKSGEWSLSWANASRGRLETPMIGSFEGKIGKFYDQETFEGRSIYVRFLWKDITSSTCRWEQAFSVDGGQSWETNWIMQMQRQD